MTWECCGQWRLAGAGGAGLREVLNRSTSFSTGGKVVLNGSVPTLYSYVQFFMHPCQPSVFPHRNGTRGPASRRGSLSYRRVVEVNLSRACEHWLKMPCHVHRTHWCVERILPLLVHMRPVLVRAPIALPLHHWVPFILGGWPLVHPLPKQTRLPTPAIRSLAIRTSGVRGLSTGGDEFAFRISSSPASVYCQPWLRATWRPIDCETTTSALFLDHPRLLSALCCLWVYF